MPTDDVPIPEPKFVDSNLDDAYARLVAESRDKEQLLRDQNRRYQRWSIGFILLALTGIVTPLFYEHSVEYVPIILRVDANGMPDVPLTLDPKTVLNVDMVAYWAVQYVQCRESYFPGNETLHQRQATQCAMFTPKDKRDGLIEVFDTGNAQKYNRSLFAQYGTKGRAVVTPRYAMPMGDKGDTIEVHYTLTKYMPDSPDGVSIPMVARIVHDRFDDVGGNVMKYHNPQGFRVREFTTRIESIEVKKQ
jgi:hypothetical protein